MAELRDAAPAATQEREERAHDTEGGRQSQKGRADAWVKLGILVVLLAGVLMAARFTPLGTYLTRDGVGEAIAWLRGHAWAPVIFIALYASATAVGIPGSVLTLAGGVLFGFFWGTVFNSIAANLGANAAFLIARGLGRDGVRRLLGDNSEALRKLDRIAGKHGFRGLLTLRLIPLIPFNVLNFGSGLMSVRWSSYTLATALGILPGTMVYTFFADALLQGSTEASRDALARVLIAGALLVLLSFLPTLLKRFNVRLPGVSAVALAALVAGTAAWEPASASPAGPAQLPDHRLFSQVLADVVGDAGVDYQRLKDWPEPLDDYLASLSDADPAQVAAASRDERLAFWINAYNACMLKRVIEHYPLQPAGGLHGARNRLAGRPANSVWQIEDVFSGDHCRVAGEERSQDEIEHEIVRPLGDPRIHFAINCAAKSCPPLIREAYQSEALNEQLDARVLAFVADPVHFSIDDGGDRSTVRVNKVLDWFIEDFGGTEGLRGFLSRYVSGTDQDALLDPDTELRFFDYDWTLNDAKP